MRILKYNDKLVEGVGHEDKMNNMKNKIKNILNDTEFWQPKLIEKIEKDLNDGKFYQICSNETTFKNYVLAIINIIKQ